MSEPTQVYAPRQAADELGITTQSLRRYAQHYAEVFGEVPQHAGQRVFTAEIVERLAAAQALQQGGEAPSIKAALELVGDGAPVDALERQDGPTFEAVVLERLEKLTAAVERLTEENRVLHTQLRALEAPTESGKPEYVANMEAIHADLERRHNALLGEMERRRLEGEKTKRPRWRWWGR